MSDEIKDSRLPFPFSHQIIITDANNNPIAIEYKEGGWYDENTQTYIGGITVFKQYINNDANGNVINNGRL
jgi:hypothetical protein